MVDSQKERRDSEPAHRDYESCEPTRKHEPQALDRCEARRAQRKEHRHRRTERSGKLDRDSMKPRFSLRCGYFELAAQEQRQVMREFPEEFLGSFSRSTACSSATDIVS